MTATWITHGADETQALGRALGAALEQGDLLLLHGPLGAGKTTLTQGLAWGAGVEGYAHSPTFVIVHEYAGRITVYHLDLYRLDAGLLEAHDLGIDEMLDAGACVVEWAEKASEIFPGPHLDVTLEPGAEPHDRRITLEPHGERAEALVTSVAVAVGEPVA